MVARMICPAIEGTLYLKQLYQKNMIAALMMGVILHFAALGTYITLTNPAPLDDAIGKAIKEPIRGVFVLPPPPSIGDPRPPAKKYDELPGSIPKFGSQFLIGDWNDEDIGLVPTRIEREYAVHQDVGEGDYDREMGRLRKDIQKELPVRGEFVFYQVNPEPIRLIVPSYPEMARRAGIAATVVMSVLVDIDGYVLDAVVESCSVENIGFEEAALQAALKGYWSPAIQSDQTVACWTAYAIVFELD